METLTLRALLVDDDRVPRLRLRQLLRAHPEVEIVGEADGAVEAERLAREFQPDVIFLDVQMPRVDGFALLPRLEVFSQIVFVTSFDRYALRGFEVNAFDYLLKPVQPPRLALTIRRLVASIRVKAAREHRSTVDDILVVGAAERTRTIPVGSIAGIRAEGNYSRVYFADGASILMLRTLADWKHRLPVPPFARLDRSLFVNLDRVAEFTAESRNSAFVRLEGTTDPIRLGRTASTRLRAAQRARLEEE